MSEIIFTNWVNQYTKELYKWAYHKVADKETAEDLVQDTFLAAYHSFSSFKGDSNPQTWLFAILNRKIIDYYRAQARSIVQHEMDAIQDRVIVYSDDLFVANGGWKSYSTANWDTNDADLLDTPDFIEAFNDCMAKLPNRWQTSIKAKYLLEKDSKEICKELEITPSNYWQILHRTKLLLKQCLENNWFKL